jgi:hypothetical protein
MRLCFSTMCFDYIQEHFHLDLVTSAFLQLQILHK